MCQYAELRRYNAQTLALALAHTHTHFGHSIFYLKFCILIHHPNQNQMQKRYTLSLLALFCCLSINFSQAQNTVFPYAGTGSPGFVNGDTSVASFNSPRGIVVDATGNLFVVDGLNHCIRKIATDGTVSTFAGSGIAGFMDGVDSVAQFREPYNLCIDAAGNLYVSDFLNHSIRKVSANGTVTTIAGNGVAGYQDGPDLVARFSYPRGICVDAAGNLYVGDSWNHRIRKITPMGQVSTYAGGGNIFGVQSVSSFADGPDTTARFYTPTEVSCDTAGNVYVADAFNHRIRKIDVNRVVTTVAGSGPSGATAGGFQNGPGNQALFTVPTACFAARDGSIFTGAGSNHVIRRIDQSNFVSTFAGTGMQGGANGLDSLATFNFPRATVMDYANDRLYLVDFGNHSIRYIQLSTANAVQDPTVTAVEVFPNPFGDRVTLRAATVSTGNAQIRILNSLGQEVFKTDVWMDGNDLGSETELDLSALQAGIYFLHVLPEEKSEVFPVIRLVRD